MPRSPRRTWRLPRCALLLVGLLAPGPAGADPPGDAAGPAPEAVALVEGVRRLALPGVPGTLSVFGPDAFPVVAAPCDGRPAALVAAARHGQGRAVLFGHDYFEDALDVGDTAKLVERAVRWAAGGDRKRPRVGLRGFGRGVARLERMGFEVVRLDGAGWLRGLRDVDAAVLPLADLQEDEVAEVRRRLRAGLGVLAGMPGWGWQQLHPGRSLAEENAGNRLLAPAGLVWGAGTVQKPAGGVLEVGGPAPWLTHAGRALEALRAQAEDPARLARADAATAVATLTRAVHELPARESWIRPQLERLLRRGGARVVPTHDRPLTDADGLGKLLLAVQLQRDAELPPGQIQAHAAAEVFPGAVPARARRVRRGVEVDAAVPGWHSTGLYAAPGEVVTLTVPAAWAARGLELRIGAHKDGLWGVAAWRRAPQITRVWPVTSARTEGACAFGGPLYVVVPPGAPAEAFEATLAGAVEAPHFVLGRTTLEAWREDERGKPAPWAELESSKLVVTVPSEHVRAVDDPEALMRWWDRVMDGCADLAARPHARARPERYVADEQISVGYMHAGYPIMTHLDAAPRFVDLATLSAKGDWGMFHEMGHNHQQPDWTFDGTVEVTCNLFSLYLMETVCAKGVGHEAMSEASIAKHRAAYEKGGRAFGLWKSQPFTALIMYQQLRTAFGWEAYKRVFAEYRDLLAGERPQGDDAKRDQWLVRMSRTVGRDLGPFFESWGIPVSKAARAQVAALPAWMPAPPDSAPR